MSGHDSGENAHADHKGAVGILPFFVANNKVGTELEDEAGATAINAGNLAR